MASERAFMHDDEAPEFYQSYVIGEITKNILFLEKDAPSLSALHAALWGHPLEELEEILIAQRLILEGYTEDIYNLPTEAL